MPKMYQKYHRHPRSYSIQVAIHNVHRNEANAIQRSQPSSSENLLLFVIPKHFPNDFGLF